MMSIWSTYSERRKGNTISLLRCSLCQKFSAFFCGGGGAVFMQGLNYWRHLFFLKRDPLVEFSMGAAGRLPVTGWHQEVKFKPVSTAIQWWTLGAPFLASHFFGKYYAISKTKHNHMCVYRIFLHLYLAVSPRKTTLTCQITGKTSSWIQFDLIQLFTVVLSRVKTHLTAHTGTQAKWTWQMEQKS